MRATAEHAVAGLSPSLVRLRPAAGGREILRRDVAQLSDEALLEAVAGSDEAALGELYDRFGRVAYGLALRILRDATLAEDAVQEAFLQVWRGATAYRPERAKASTWVLTFVHRRAVDLVRREERRRGEPEGALPEPAGPGADEAVVARSRREIVQDALSRLPADQREAIELAYFGGLTQSELAERLSQPLGTIKSRMFTGLQRLQALLVEAGFERA
jgi:RNA polymerase sigma factor (sigma-70 family)